MTEAPQPKPRGRPKGSGLGPRKATTTRRELRMTPAGDAGLARLAELAGQTPGEWVEERVQRELRRLERAG